MKKIVMSLLLLLTCSLLVSCKSRAKGEAELKGTSPVTFKKIEISQRDHGYSNLHNIVLANSRDLELFIDTVQSQDGWGQKELFVSALINSGVDFETQNVVLYLHTESSGSIQLNIAEPALHGDNVQVKIERTVPAMGTMDMAYYALAYIIDKRVPQFEVVIADQVIRVNNSKSK